MLSMKDIASVKTAVLICNSPYLKKEILCVPGSDYDLSKRSHRENKLRWYEIVEKNASVILENSGLSKQLQEEVISIVFAIGMKMLLWSEYHRSILDVSREYIASFFKNSFFTSQGMMNSKKVAEELMKNESLNIRQKYKIACLYCFTDDIPVLFKKMTIADKMHFYHAENPRKIKQPEIVKFWSYYLMSEIDKLKGERNIDHYRLEKAVRSGSKSAVEYCLEKTKLRTMVDSVFVAALETFRCRISVKPDTDSERVFGELGRGELWVPSDYYVEILCFLFSKIGRDQQVELLKKKVEVIESESDYYRRVTWALLEGERIEKKHSEKCFILLEYLLNWPYQGYFMKKAKLMWEFLPESYYATLLLMICDRIEFRYTGGKSFDYRTLLKEFWCQSPDRYKRCTFKNQYVTYRTNTKEIQRVKTGVGLIIKLLTLKNFTYKDEEIIKLILASATEEEKENILSTKEWAEICAKLMAREKWGTLDRYLLCFFSSKEENSKFKKEFSFRGEVQTVCIDFTKNDNWNAAESFIKWSFLPREKIKELKEEMINSWYGLQSCVRQFLFGKKVKSVDSFLRWYLSSEEEVKAFKKKLIFSDYGISSCSNFVKNKQKLVNELINFCLSSEGEIRELKKMMAYRDGGRICKRLISDNSYCSNSWFNNGIRFDGGKWEEVENFLTWCFSSEEEMKDFKKNKLLKEYGEEILFELIKSLQWEEAEFFFAWLGLSAEDTKQLKKRTLFDYEPASDMLIELILGNEDDEIFTGYSSKQEAIELQLRWYLTDKKMVLECKQKFSKLCDIQKVNEVDLNFFYLMIEQRLKDLEDENSGVKRTKENFSPNKRLCTLKRDTTEAEHDE